MAQLVKYLLLEHEDLNFIGPSKNLCAVVSIYDSRDTVSPWAHSLARQASSNAKLQVQKSDPIST